MSKLYWYNNSIDKYIGGDYFLHTDIIVDYPKFFGMTKKDTIEIEKWYEYEDREFLQSIYESLFEDGFTRVIIESKVLDLEGWDEDSMDGAIETFAPRFSEDFEITVDIREKHVKFRYSEYLFAGSLRRILEKSDEQVFSKFVNLFKLSKMEKRKLICKFCKRMEITSANIGINLNKNLLNTIQNDIIDVINTLFNDVEKKNLEEDVSSIFIVDISDLIKDLGLNIVDKFLPINIKLFYLGKDKTIRDYPPGIYFPHFRSIELNIPFRKTARGYYQIIISQNQVRETIHHELIHYTEHLYRNRKDFPLINNNIKLMLNNPDYYNEYINHPSEIKARIPEILSILKKKLENNEDVDYESILKEVFSNRLTEKNKRYILKKMYEFESVHNNSKDI